MRMNAAMMNMINKLVHVNVKSNGFCTIEVSVI